MFQLFFFFFGKGSCNFVGGSHKVYISTLIYEYLNRLSFLSVSGQVPVAVGFLTRDPSLIWNTVFLSYLLLIEIMLTKHGDIYCYQCTIACLCAISIYLALKAILK